MEVFKVDGVDQPRAPCRNGEFGDQKHTGIGEFFGNGLGDKLVCRIVLLLSCVTYQTNAS